MDFINELEEVDAVIFESLGDVWTINGMQFKAITDADAVESLAGWGRSLRLIVEDKHFDSIPLDVKAERGGSTWNVADKTPPVDGVFVLILEVMRNENETGRNARLYNEHRRY